MELKSSESNPGISIWSRLSVADEEISDTSDDNSMFSSVLAAIFPNPEVAPLVTFSTIELRSSEVKPGISISPIFSVAPEVALDTNEEIKSDETDEELFSLTSSIACEIAAVASEVISCKASPRLAESIPSTFSRDATAAPVTSFIVELKSSTFIPLLPIEPTIAPISDPASFAKAEALRS